MQQMGLMQSHLEIIFLCHFRIWYCFSLEYPISNSGEYLHSCNLYRSLFKTITLAARTQCIFKNNIIIFKTILKIVNLILYLSSFELISLQWVVLIEVF